MRHALTILGAAVLAFACGWIIAGLAWHALVVTGWR